MFAEDWIKKYQEIHDMCLIGFWNTRGGKHPTPLLIEIGSGAKKVALALNTNGTGDINTIKHTNLKFVDQNDKVKAVGNDLIIFTAKKGVWIGKKGWRIKNLQRAIGKGKIIFKDIIRFIDGSFDEKSKEYFSDEEIEKLRTKVMSESVLGNMPNKLNQMLSIYLIGEISKGFGDKKKTFRTYYIESINIIKKYIFMED